MKSLSGRNRRLCGGELLTPKIAKCAQTSQPKTTFSLGESLIVSLSFFFRPAGFAHLSRFPTACAMG